MNATDPSNAEKKMSNHFGFQIKPIPDETFFGLVVAAGILAGYETYSQAYTGILGKWKTCPASMLPRGLLKICGFLPDHYQNNPDTICDKHTALPYFQSFVKPEVVSKVKEAMLHGLGLNIHNAIGLTNTSIPDSPKLKYCSTCAEEQFLQYNRSTWLRSHQLPGVNVCYRHGETLSESPIPTARYGIHSGQIKLPHTSPRAPYILRTAWSAGDEWDHSSPHRLIAQISHELLCNQPNCSDGQARGRAYRTAYIAASSSTHKVDWILLEEVLRAKYGDLIPRALQINFACGTNDNWVRRITDHREGIRHPLQHVLIIGALFDSLRHLEEVMLDQARNPLNSIEAAPVPGNEVDPSILTEPESSPSPRLNQKHISNRKALLNVVSQHPHASRSEIKIKLGIRKYKWVLLNDREWAKSILPPKNSAKRTNHASERQEQNRVSSIRKWEVLDQKLAAQILQLSPANIVQIHEGKVEANKAQIARLTGVTYSYIRKLASFPNTGAAIARMQECGSNPLAIAH